MTSNGQVFDTTDSTQTELKKKLEADPHLQNLYFVQALVQTGGVGRQKRPWLSLMGNLHLSVLLRGPHADITWVPHRIAIAVVRTLLSFGVPASSLSIKWPNDVLIDKKKKIAGILCEKTGEHVIAGLGMNVLSDPSGVVDRESISLKELMDVPTKVSAIFVDAVREQLISNLEQTPIDRKKIHSEYLQWSLFKPGDEIFWQEGTDSANEIRGGKFLRLGEFGELIVETENGEKSLFSEDVHLKT